MEWELALLTGDSNETTMEEEGASEATGTATMPPSDRECTRKEHSASVVFWKYT
jgi:hypothetical protein